MFLREWSLRRHQSHKCDRKQHAVDWCRWNADQCQHSRDCWRRGSSCVCVDVGGGACNLHLSKASTARANRGRCATAIAQHDRVANVRVRSHPTADRNFCCRRQRHVRTDRKEPIRSSAQRRRIASSGRVRVGACSLQSIQSIWRCSASDRRWRRFVANAGSRRLRGRLADQQLRLTHLSSLMTIKDDEN
jgi:hypothetical protein